jgi:hypothetical protein
VLALDIEEGDEYPIFEELLPEAVSWGLPSYSSRHDPAVRAAKELRRRLRRRPVEWHIDEIERIGGLSWVCLTTRSPS